jgi:CBS domain-containing protein
MKVSDIMTRGVISVTPDEMIDVAIELMLSNHVSGLPVIDHSGRLVGILTEGDLLRRPEIGTQRGRSRWRDAFVGARGTTQTYVHSHGVRVKDVMAPEPAVVTEDTPLIEVVRLMETRNVKRLPVMRGREVIGIVSRANLIGALLKIYREANRAPANDKVVRTRILEDIAEQDWAKGAIVDVTVRNGAVDLWGTVLEMEQAEALKTLVQSTPGIQRIEIYLTCNGEIVPVK